MDSIKQLVIFGIIALIGFLLLTSLDPALIHTLEQNPEHLYASVGAGTSMYPSIQNGDILIIQTKDYNYFNVDVGDIVIFKDLTNKTIAHRVIAIQNELYLVKGDNVVEPDGFLRYEDILGKIINIIRRDNLIARAYVEAKL